VAAHLAGGTDPGRLGNCIEDFARLEITRPLRVNDHIWRGVVLKIDRFGNIITNFGSDILVDRIKQGFQVRIGSTIVERFHDNYWTGSGQEPFVIAGSSGYLEISIKESSAVSLLRCAVGDSLTLEFPTHR
jgi:S-adenosylmethionine hydrolase